MADVIIGGVFNNNFMTRFWQWIITDVFHFIGNYGLRVIFITVLLKLLLSPIDFFTRRTNKINADKTEQMKPELEKLQKQYANNPTELQRRRMALNKKYGYNAMGACLPMLVTMFVFITLFGGFTDTAKVLNVRMYEGVTHEYIMYYVPATTGEWPKGTDNPGGEIDINYYIGLANQQNDEWIDYEIGLLRDSKEHKDKTDEELSELFRINKNISHIVRGDGIFTQENIASGQDLNEQYKLVSQYIAQGEVLNIYNTQEKEEFLWIKNVWRPDTWSNPIYDKTAFKNLTGRGDSYGNGVYGLTQDSPKPDYNSIMGRVRADYAGQWNGWLILVAASVGLNFLNQFIMGRQQKLNQDPTQKSMMGSMKIMMFMMPVMIGMFALSQSAAFTIYMTTNALMTLIINLASTGLLKLLDYKKAKPASPYSR